MVFSENNTQGYTKEELDAMNTAHARIMQDVPANLSDDLREQVSKSVAERLLALSEPDYTGRFPAGHAATWLYNAYYG